MAKKKDRNMGLIVGALAAVVIVVLVLPMLGIDLGETSLQIAPGQEVTITDTTKCTPKLIENLTISTTEKGSNDAGDVSGTVNIYDSGVNPSLPNSEPIDTITISSGVGHTNLGKIYSCTPYEITIDGSSTYYDMFYNGEGDDVLAEEIVTDQATIGKYNIRFKDVITVGSYSDPLDETTTGGDINGQTNVSGEASSSNEIQVGTDSSPANADTIYYNETNGDEDFYIKFSIGCAGGYKYCEDTVLCFDWEDSAEPEGNEYSSITASHDSGNELLQDFDFTDAFSSGSCIWVGDMKGGQSEKIQVNFYPDEAATDTNDDFKISINDLGGDAPYTSTGLDIERGAKISKVSMDFDHEA